MSTPVLPTTPIPRSADPWYEAFGSQHRSQLTGTEQRVRRWGRWRAIYVWEHREQDAISELEAFFNARGIDESFLIHRPDRPQPRAVVGGTGRDAGGNWSYGGYTPKVKGASQTGRSLLTDGWPASTLIFSAGDVFTLTATLGHFQVTAAVTSTAGGEATLPLGQYIRTSPADNADIDVLQAQILVRLDRPARITVTSPLLYAITAEMTEV